MTFQSTALLLAWLAIALLGLALSGLLRQVHSLRTDPMPLEVSVSSNQIARLPSVPELIPQNAGLTVALFSDPGCASCSRLLPVFDSIAADSRDAEFTILFAGAGNGVQSDRIRLLRDQQQLFEKLRIPVTPFVVAVDAEGTVRGSSPVGSPTLLELFVRNMTDGGQL